MASNLRAMLDGCRGDWGNPGRFLILADYIDDYVGDTDWSALIRLSVEFPPPSASDAWHPELRDSFERMAARFGLWPSRIYTRGCWMWTEAPDHGSLKARPCLWWKWGVATPATGCFRVLPAETLAALELMQPGFRDTGE